MDKSNSPMAEQINDEQPGVHCCGRVSSERRFQGRRDRPSHDFPAYLSRRSTCVTLGRLMPR
jgi:hypothetical protein